jgi:hypothetical protein
MKTRADHEAILWALMPAVYHLEQPADEHQKTDNDAMRRAL